MELLKKVNVPGRSRRKFLTFGAAATGSLLLTVTGIFRFGGRKKAKSARFLTQSGKLVEVDIAHLPWWRKVATREQLMNWVHRKKDYSS